MHKSKLAGFIIDCKTGDVNKAADFWSNALGMKQHRFEGEEAQKYVRLMDEQNNLHIEVQSVQHDSRVHLDIETDDIEAEVSRLQKLGAEVVSKVKTWCVMRAPTGQQFCVVNKSSPDFEQKCNEWG